VTDKQLQNLLTLANKAEAHAYDAMKKAEAAETSARLAHSVTSGVLEAIERMDRDEKGQE